MSVNTVHKKPNIRVLCMWEVVLQRYQGFSNHQTRVEFFLSSRKNNIIQCNIFDLEDKVNSTFHLYYRVGIIIISWFHYEAENPGYNLSNHHYAQFVGCSHKVTNQRLSLQVIRTIYNTDCRLYIGLITLKLYLFIYYRYL